MKCCTFQHYQLLSTADNETPHLCKNMFYTFSMLHSPGIVPPPFPSESLHPFKEMKPDLITTEPAQALLFILNCTPLHFY